MNYAGCVCPVHSQEPDAHDILARQVRSTLNEGNFAIKLRLIVYFRDRPAPIPIEVKSIDDTSNFDEFPDLDMNFEPSGKDIKLTSIHVYLLLDSPIYRFCLTALEILICGGMWRYPISERDLLAPQGLDNCPQVGRTAGLVPAGGPIVVFFETAPG
jgi:hypothetical protein